MHFLLRGISVLLAFVVLITTTCFGADVHFCESEFQSYALFDTAKPCGNMELKQEKVSPCCLARKKRIEQELKDKTVFKKAKCCHNEQVEYKYDQNTGTSFAFDLVAFEAIVVKPIVLFEVVDGFEITSRDNFFRGPPEPQYYLNRQVFYQVFRI